MQKVLTKYWLAIHVGLLLFMSWYGLTQPRGVDRQPLLWLALLAVETFVILPSVRKGETLADARARVWQAWARDPLTYLGLAVVGVVAIQWLNSGCTLVYLSDADIWQFSRPPVAWLPYAIDPKPALATVSVLLACVTAGLVLRLGVNRSGKRYLLQVASAFSGAIGVVWVWRFSAGVEPYAGLAAHPPACNAGSFFGLWLLVGMGVYLDALSRGQRATELLFALGFIGNLVAMLFFSSMVAVLFYGVVALALAIYWFVFLALHRLRSTQLKLFLATLMVIACTTLSLVYLFPGNPVVEKMGGLATWRDGWRTLTVDRETRASAGLKIWKAHPWVGVGAGGFSQYVGTVVEGKDWAVIQRDQGFVRNDCLQVLCEYGALGGGLLLAVIIALFIPIVYRLRIAWQAGAIGEHESRWMLFRLSPLVVAGIPAAAICFAESWIASPLQSPAILASWFVVLAIMPTFLPEPASR